MTLRHSILALCWLTPYLFKKHGQVHEQDWENRKARVDTHKKKKETLQSSVVQIGEVLSKRSKFGRYIETECQNDPPPPPFCLQ